MNTSFSMFNCTSVTLAPAGDFMDNLKIVQEHFGDNPKIKFKGFKSNKKVKLSFDGVFVDDVVNGIVPQHIIGARNLIKGSTKYSGLMDDGYEIRKVINRYDEIVDIGYDLWKARQPEIRSLEDILVDGKIPKNNPNSEINGFHKWFDKLKEGELELILRDKDLKLELEDRIRWPGKEHEWCMVCEVMQFKEWKVPMSEIHRFRTKTKELTWTIPEGLDDAGMPGAHGKTGSNRFHKELREVIQLSKNIKEFNTGITELVKRWKIDPNLLPDLIIIK